MAFFNTQLEKCDFRVATFFKHLNPCLKNGGAFMHRTQAVFQQPAKAKTTIAEAVEQGKRRALQAVAGPGRAKPEPAATLIPLCYHHGTFLP